MFILDYNSIKQISSLFFLVILYILISINLILSVIHNLKAKMTDHVREGS